MRVVWFGLLVGVVGCGDGAGEGLEDTDTDSVAELDTEEQVDPALVRACILKTWFVQNCTGCHFGGNHLVLTSDPLEVLRTAEQELNPGEPLLVPGDADASWLVRKVEARAGLVTLEEGEGDPMPPDREISEADAQRVRAWVESGAPDCPD